MIVAPNLSSFFPLFATRRPGVRIPSRPPTSSPSSTTYPTLRNSIDVMATPNERRLRAQRTVLAWIEPLVHKKVEWDSLPAEIKLKFEPYLEEMSCKPEIRMRKTMETIATTLKLRWRTDSPPDHLYDARLDCVYRKLHPAVSRQMSHCYFLIAFLTQAPVPRHSGTGGVSTTQGGT